MKSKPQKSIQGFSWRWNNADKGPEKHVLFLTDDESVPLLGDIWTLRPGRTIDWAGASPWLDNISSYDMFDLGSEEFLSLMKRVLGEYRQAAIIILEGGRFYPGVALIRFLRELRKMAPEAGLYYAGGTKGRGRMLSWKATGVEYMDLGGLDRGQKAQKLLKLAEKAIDSSHIGPREEFPREDAEWTIHTFDRNKKNIPRILLVGDSISYGYGCVVQKTLVSRFAVDRLHTSEGTFGEKYLRLLDFMLERQNYNLIHINNGLHLHGIGAGEYKKNVRNIFCHLKAKSKADIIFALTTPVHDEKNLKKLNEKKNNEVIEINSRAAALCREFKIGINDLYGYVLDNSLSKVDQVHFDKNGYEALAGQVIKEILNRF